MGAAGPVSIRSGSSGSQKTGLGQLLQGQAGGRSPLSALGAALQQPLQITGYLIHLQIDPVAGFPARDRGLLGGVGHYGEPKRVALDGVDRQADAIHRNRALLGDVAGKLRCRLDPVFEGTTAALLARHYADAVDMTGDQVPAEALTRSQRSS